MIAILKIMAIMFLLITFGSLLIEFISDHFWGCVFIACILYFIFR